MSKLNEVQRTMLEQLNSLNPIWRGEFGVETIVITDENTLRFPMRFGKHRVNFDLTYDRGRDLYNAKAYRVSDFLKQFKGFKKPTEEEWEKATKAITILDVTGFFWDQLVDEMREVAKQFP